MPCNYFFKRVERIVYPSPMIVVFPAAMGFVVRAEKCFSSGKSFVGHRSRHLPGHVARQVRPIVIVALDHSDVLMPGESLDGPDIPAGSVQGFRDRRMTQAMRPHLQTRFPPQLANHPVEPSSGEPKDFSLVGPVHGEK
jgi:hypothetical protein